MPKVLPGLCAFFHIFPENNYLTPTTIRGYIHYPTYKGSQLSTRRLKPRSISITDDLWEQVKLEASETGQPVSTIVVHIISAYFRSKIVRKSSWDTDEEDWYDPHKFFTFSQDKYGHSAKIDVTIPKHVAGEIKGIVDSGRIPELRTPQDFYRNAIRHECHRIGKMIEDDALVEASHFLTIRDRVLNEQAVATEAQKHIEAVKTVLEEALILEHYDFIEYQLKGFWKDVSSIPERFKDDYIECLKFYQEESVRKRVARNKGTMTFPDGRRFKNGIELSPEDVQEDLISELVDGSNHPAKKHRRKRSADE